MTQQEKQTVAVLRSEGMSYNAIASHLDIPLNSVKTFCRRNRLGGVRAIGNLSEETGDNSLIDTENRGNSTTTKRAGSPDRTGMNASKQVKIHLEFSETPDEEAILDVLGMLMRSNNMRG